MEICRTITQSNREARSTVTRPTAELGHQAGIAPVTTIEQSFVTPSPQLRARHNPLERRPEPWVYSAKRCEVETTSKSNKIRQTKNTAVKLHCLRSAQIKTGRTVKSNQIKTHPRTIEKPTNKKKKQNTSKDPPSGTLVGRRTRHGKSMASQHSVQKT